MEISCTDYHISLSNANIFSCIFFFLVYITDRRSVCNHFFIMEKENSTRKTILSTARELFIVRGYDATSVQDIMKALHISKGGIYHYFASKDEILSEIIKEETGPLIQSAREVFENTTLGIQEKFMKWMEVKTTFYEDKYGLLRKVFVECQDISLRFRIIQLLKQEIKPIVEKALSESKEEIPRIREITNLLLCAHELVFSYGLAEVTNEKDFKTYLDTIKHLANKIFS